MWFVGLIIGAIGGGFASGGAGAAVGALVGAFVGWAIANSSKGADESRLDALGRGLDELRARIAALERRIDSQGRSSHETTTAPSDAAPTIAPGAIEASVPEFSASAEPVPIASPEDVAALGTLKAAVEETAARIPQPPGAPEQPKPSATAPQVIGALIGAVIVGSFAGIEGALVGALLGWLAVFAVQSQNRRAARDAAAHRAAREQAASVSAAVVEEARVAEPAQEYRPHPTDSSAPGPAVESPVSAADGSAWLQHLIGGNIVAKIGVLILFFGVGFLLKYAYDQGRLPVQVRLAGVGAVGLAMLYAGHRLLGRRRLYGLILQGGGIGLLYLDVFFALKVYGLVGATLGFAAFMLLGVAATLLAVRQDAKILAVLGLTGAFLAPILASTQSGNHVLLFSYYALLNGFILAISWFKAWRELNLVGFIFTFAVGALWGANNYRPELFASVEPFVLLFFAMYLVIPILFAQRQPPELKGLVDGTLVFGTPLCASFMQAGLVKDLPYGLAWSAGVAGALYAVLAAMTIRRAGLRLLGETYVALAIVFSTLAIFFAFDAYVTFALWTLEGAAIVWVGLRQKRLLARWFGLALQLAGAAYFLIEYERYSLANPWWNDFVLGCVLISVAGFITARLLHRYRETLVVAAEPNGAVLLLWGALWWSIAGVHALYHAHDWPRFVVALLAFVALSMSAVELVGRRLAWTGLRKLALAHVPALFALAVLMAIGEHGRVEFVRPFAHGGYWAWPLNFAVAFWVHARQMRDGVVSSDSAAYRAAWLLAGVLATWDALWLIDRDLYGQALAWGGAAMAAACLRFSLRERADDGVARIAVPVLAWGMVFWFYPGAAWIDRALAPHAVLMATLAFVAGTCLVFEVVGSAISWRALRRAAALLVAGMVLIFLAQIMRSAHPFAAYGWITWPAAFALLYVALRRQEDDRIALFAPMQHVAALWLGVAILTWEGVWQMRTLPFGSAWVTAAYGLIPAAALGVIASIGARASWPFGAHYQSIYRGPGLGPIAAYVALWVLYANVSAPGSMRPVPYVPVLNVLDLALLAGCAALWRWSRTTEMTTLPMKPLAGALAFLWVNCVMLRTFHYWAGIAYEWSALWSSVLVQAGFSLLWTATALVVMLSATRGNRRQLWMAGAALLGVVVVKLLLNDLSNTGTVARIVSFIGVGAGLLVIGYVAPVPPGETERAAD